jgi:hypothetical protein
MSQSSPTTAFARIPLTEVFALVNKRHGKQHDKQHAKFQHLEHTDAVVLPALNGHRQHDLGRRRPCIQDCLLRCCEGR